MPLSPEEQREFDKLEYEKLVAERERSIGVSSFPPADPTGGPEARLQRKEIVANRNYARKKEADFVAKNVEEGIPLLTRKELPALKRARLSAEPDPSIQVKMLNAQGIPARLSKDGDNVIVRQKTEDGKEEDILLYPFGPVTMGAVAGQAAPIAKGLASAGVGIASGGLASLPLAAAAMGIGAAGTELVSTGGSRLLAGQPLGDVGTRAREAGTIEAAFPILATGAKAGLQGSRAILARNRSQLAEDVVGAGERTGIPLFPSQTTDSKFLAQAENMAGLSKLNADQDAAIRASIDREIGPSGRAGVLAESDVAKKVQPIFKADADALEQSARKTMTAAEEKAQRELVGQLNSGVFPIAPGNSLVARNTRQKFEDFVAKVKADADVNYPKFYSQAATEGIELDKKYISDLVAKIEKEDPQGVAEFLAPSIRQVKQVEKKLTEPTTLPASGLLSAKGTPVAATTVPAAPLTFDEAIRQRAIVRQKINAPDDALGDVVKSYYKQLEKAYSDAIDDGLKRGSKTLRSLYDVARGAYAQGADALEKGVVQKLFREAGEAGRIPDEAVIPQIFSGAGKLEALQDIKQILGPNSMDYKLLLRQGIQNMIDSAEQKGSGRLIDVQAFLNKFNGLSREMRDEVFGTLAQPLKSAADAMTIAQKGVKSAVNIPADELADALAASPKDVKNLIEDAVARQKIFEDEYVTGIKSQLTGGKAGLHGLGNLDTFVTTFVPKASAADMRQVLTRMDAVTPGSADEFRQKVMANIGDEILTDKGLSEEAIKKYITGENAEKYAVILGRRGVEFLEDLKTIAASNAKRLERIKSDSGAISAAKYGTAAAIGFSLAQASDLPGGVGAAAGPLILAAPKILAGNAVRSQAVRDFLTTGKLPILGSIKKGLEYGGLLASEREIAGGLLAAPGIMRTTAEVKKKIGSDNSEEEMDKR